MRGLNQSQEAKDEANPRATGKAFVVAGAACPPQLHSSAAQAQVQPAASCEAITMSQAVPFKSLSYLELTPLMNPDRLTPIRARPLAGDCPTHVRVYDGTRFLLTNGKTLMPRGDVTTAEPAPARNAIDPSVLMSSLDGAGADGDGFLFAYRIGSRYRNGVAEYARNLGVWGTADSYELRAFLTQGRELAGPIEPIMRSAKPILGLSFSPLPDAPMGSLHLVIETSPGAATAASLNWHFQDFVTLI